MKTRTTLTALALFALFLFAACTSEPTPTATPRPTATLTADEACADGAALYPGENGVLMPCATPTLVFPPTAMPVAGLPELEAWSDLRLNVLLAYPYGVSPGGTIAELPKPWTAKVENGRLFLKEEKGTMPSDSWYGAIEIQCDSPNREVIQCVTNAYNVYYVRSHGTPVLQMWYGGTDMEYPVIYVSYSFSNDGGEYRIFVQETPNIPSDTETDE